MLTLTDLKSRFLGQKLNPLYLAAIKMHERLRVHADGDIPIKLIKKARPNESEAVQLYREAIYESETQNPVERVLGILEKIRRSPDWMIRFSGDVPPIISKDETLEKYLTQNYPVYNHVEDWLFQEVLKNLALDANSVILVAPLSFTVASSQYLEPAAQVYNARDVLDFSPGDFVIVRSEEYSSLLTDDDRRRRVAAAHSVENMEHFLEGFRPAQVYYCADTTAYYKFQEQSDGAYQLTDKLAHGLGELPAFQMPGKFVKRAGNNILKKTLLYAMVPHLNKAARESNDLDAGVIMHLYPEKWRINNIPCPKCNGTAKEQTPTGVIPCRECKGTGMANGKSPFNEIVIRPSALGESNIPTPPLGYVEKNTDIIKLQSERVEQHIYRALSAVNMEHLADAQMNQSGVAKSYDRDDVNNLIYSFAGDLVTVLQAVIYFISELRYKDVVPAVEARRAMLPVIPVPEKFDVINTTFLLQEYQTAKTAGLNAVILAELQKEIGQKKFYANPAVAKTVQTIMELDPFPEKTIEEKSLLEAQQLATKADVVLSNYISDFVSQAIEDDPGFLEKTKTQKREILLEYATGKVDLLNTAKVISQDIFQPDAAQVATQDTMAAFQKDTALMSRVQNAKV